MKFKDYYATLGLPRDADADQVKEAYRKLARKYHPDVSKEPDAEERFKEVGEAYETLKDPEKRAAYDQLGKRRPGESFVPPRGWREEAGPAFTDLDGMDLSDLLDALGRQRRGRRRAPVHGEDFEVAVRLTLEQAHQGANLDLDLPHRGGVRTVVVTIPAGVVQGQVVRLKGHGGKGRRGGPDGDVYLRVELIAHPVFRVDGHDLEFDLLLAPWEAALGAEVKVAGLDGDLMLKVPAGSGSGRKLRLRSHGLANGRGGRGDLYAVARIEVPARLTARERELYQGLAEASSFKPREAVGIRSQDA